MSGRLEVLPNRSKHVCDSMCAFNGLGKASLHVVYSFFMFDPGTDYFLCPFCMTTSRNQCNRRIGCFRGDAEVLFVGSQTLGWEYSLTWGNGSAKACVPLTAIDALAVFFLFLSIPTTAVWAGALALTAKMYDLFLGGRNDDFSLGHTTFLPTSLCYAPPSDPYRRIHSNWLNFIVQAVVPWPGLWLSLCVSHPTSLTPQRNRATSATPAVRGGGRIGYIGQSA